MHFKAPCGPFGGLDSTGKANPVFERFGPTQFRGFPPASIGGGPEDGRPEGDVKLTSCDRAPLSRLIWFSERGCSHPVRVEASRAVRRSTARGLVRTHKLPVT